MECSTYARRGGWSTSVWQVEIAVESAVSERKVAPCGRTSGASRRGETAERHVGKPAPVCVSCVAVIPPRSHPSEQHQGSAQAIVRMKSTRIDATCTRTLRVYGRLTHRGESARYTLPP